MVWNLVAGLGISFGARLLGGLFGGGGGIQTVSRINEQGFVSEIAQPTSQYGAHIPMVWGNTRVTGNMVWAGEALDRVDQWDTEQTSGNTRTITTNRQAYYYGHAVWIFARTVTNPSDFDRIYLNDAQCWDRGGGLHYEQGVKYFTDPGLPANAGGVIGGPMEFRSWIDGDQLNFLEFREYGWRQRTVCEIKELFLGQFNNSYPAIEAVLFRDSDPACYLDEIVRDLLLEAGFAEEEFDLAELADIPVRGFRTTDTSAVEQWLQQLQQCFFFDYFESQGKLKFIKLDRPGISATIPLSEMAAHEAGSDVPDRIEVTIASEDDLPSLVELTYPTITDVFFERKTTRSASVRADEENILSVSVEVSLTDEEATAIANRLLAAAWAQRKTYRFSVLPKYSHLEPGDVVAVEVSPGAQDYVQITRTDQGANGLIRIDGRFYGAPNLTDPGGGFPGGGSFPPFPGGGGIIGGGPVAPPTGPGLEVPAVVPTTVTLQELDGAGVAVFLTADEGWRSATLFVSRDGEETYVPFATSQRLSTPMEGGGFDLEAYYAKLNIFPDDVGQTLYVKAVSLGQELDDAVAATITITGRGLLGGITGFSPSQGEPPLAISIFGFGFTTATGATINEIALTNFVVVDDGTITATVPEGVTNGKIVVTVLGGEIVSPTEFVVTQSSAEWGTITGEIRDQLDLQDRFDRIRRYTHLLTNATVPSVGNTIQVELEDPDGFAPTVPVCLFGGSTVGGTTGYAQLLCTARDGNILTLQRDEVGLVTETEFIIGNIIAPIVDNTVNIYGGVGVLQSQGIESFGSVYLSAPKNKTIPLFTATRDFVITGIRGLRLGSGTLSLTIQINGFTVTGLGSLSVTTTIQNPNATGGNAGTVDDRVTAVISGSSSPEDLEFTLGVILL